MDSGKAIGLRWSLFYGIPGVLALTEIAGGHVNKDNWLK